MQKPPGKHIDVPMSVKLEKCRAKPGHLGPLTGRYRDFGFRSRGIQGGYRDMRFKEFIGLRDM